MVTFSVALATNPKIELRVEANFRRCVCGNGCFSAPDRIRRLVNVLDTSVASVLEIPVC